MKIKLLCVSLFVLFRIGTVFAQKDQAVEYAAQYELKEDIQSVPCKDADRLEAVKRLFKKMGAKDDDIKIENFKDVQNLTVSKKGSTDQTIIVGAHYDKVPVGCGAIDNWTGIVVMAYLYQIIKDLDTEKSYIFVAFGREEEGLLGSSAMVKAIPKEKYSQYCSMVNLDSFGFDYPQVLEKASDHNMIRMAGILAKEINMPFAMVNMGNNVDADSSSFKKIEIPAITFHGLTRSWPSFLHTGNDRVDNINMSSVYTGYKFTLRYLFKLDPENCDIFRQPQGIENRKVK